MRRCSAPKHAALSMLREEALRSVGREPSKSPGSVVQRFMLEGVYPGIVPWEAGALVRPRPCRQLQGLMTNPLR